MKLLLGYTVKQNPGPINGGLAPIYGAAGKMPDRGCGFCTSGRRDTYLRPRASSVGCCGCHVERRMRSENLKTEELHGAPSRPPSSRLPVSVTDGGADGCDSPSRQLSSGRRSEGRMAGWGRERPADARIRARARDLQAHRLLITTRDIIFYGRRSRLSPSSTLFPSRSLPSVFPVHHPPPVLASHRHSLSSSLSLSLHPSASPVPLPSQRLPGSSSASGPRQSSPSPVVLAVFLAPPIGFTGPAPFLASSLFIIRLRSSPVIAIPCRPRCLRSQ
ncbi:hypothetical protein ACLOJK_008359 [Asimina triloba]